MAHAYQQRRAYVYASVLGDKYAFDRACALLTIVGIRASKLRRICHHPTSVGLRLLSREPLQSRVVNAVRRYFRTPPLPRVAEDEKRRDRDGRLQRDPGVRPAINGALDWLCAAHDRSKTADGGVARDYSLIKGWASSYPETTGYIIPTFVAHARENDGRRLKMRARRMLDWLAAIQLPTGAFYGGKIDSTPRKPVTFNTGQILIGLACGERVFGGYRTALELAADWLVATQDPDGCWRKYPTPFATPGEKTYETHVAWGLLEADRVHPDRGYGDAAMRNIRWACGKQRSNGWLADCCLTDPSQPLTHTLGYALRGLIEGYRFSGDRSVAAVAHRTADALLAKLRDDGFIAGRLRADWSEAVPWACLTGVVQIAHCWLMLYEDTGNARYLEAGRRANSFVRRTVRLDDAPEGMRGGVKGSLPVDGGYGPFEYPNWAAKFLIDSLTLEERLATRAKQPS